MRSWPSSDALIVGEDWISEHYFTTDAKSESFQAKVAGAAQGVGRGRQERRRHRPLAVHRRRAAASGRRSPTCSPSQPGTADDSLPELYADLREVLGYRSGEYILKRTGPVIGVSDSGPRRSPRRWSSSRRRAAETVEDLLAKDGKTLLSPYEADEKTTLTSVARLLSDAVRRGRRTRVRPGAGRPVAAGRRAGPLGRGPLPGRRPAAGLRAQRHQDAAARSTAP